MAAAAVVVSGRSEPFSEPPVPAALTPTLREALLKILENRPEDPVSFLSEYFENLAAASEGAAEKAAPKQQQELVPRALKQLLLCHYSRPAFSRNLASAFQILSSPIGKKKKAGLKGRAYTELLRQICADAQLSSCSLIHKLQCWDHEAVPFGVFRHGVLTCLIFMEFVKISGRLFDVVADSDEADQTLCQVLLEALKDAVNIGDSTSSVRYLNAGSKLAPDQLGQAMERALRLQKNESIPSISKEEFILLTAPLFIEKVKPVC
ncbi:tubulin polyglutamylase complex subunit 1-like [Cetorhinus maximus]